MEKDKALDNLDRSISYYDLLFEGDYTSKIFISLRYSGVRSQTMGSMPSEALLIKTSKTRRLNCVLWLMRLSSRKKDQYPMTNLRGTG